MKLKILSVSQANAILSNYVNANPIFSNLMVKGEVVNTRHTNYGYTFFSIKDDNSKLNCLTFDDLKVEDGKEVIVSGKISIYEKTGSCSFIVYEIKDAGAGKYSELFLLLYKKLEKEGFFKEEHKRPLKKYPVTIGVVTSYTGAAIQDIISVIKRKYPQVVLYIYDTKMQGDDIKTGIIKGLNILGQMDIDTIILSRGGGENDNLAQFNDYDIAKAVYDCESPVITAIGHDIDNTVVDFVSDVRAPTPSVAAELAVPDMKEVSAKLDDTLKEIHYICSGKIQGKKAALSEYHLNIQKNSPKARIFELKSKLEELRNKTGVAYAHIINQRKSELREIYLNLKLSNPYNILKDGYALIFKNGSLVKSIADIDKALEIEIILSDGKVVGKFSVSNKRYR